MERNQYRFSILTVLLVLPWIFSLVCSASPKVQECQFRPEAFNHFKPAVKNLRSLPSRIFVAQKADYYVEGKDQSFKIWGQQSFTKVESKIECISLQKEGSRIENRSFSIYAPTLIDLTPEQKVGNSFWQFHMTVEGSRVGIWNQQSRLVSKGKGFALSGSDFEAEFAQRGIKVQIFQISRDEFELILSRENLSFSETLSIRFDTVQKVD